MPNTVVGHFPDGTNAQAVFEDLERSGFTTDDVSYVAHDGSGRFADVLQRGAMRGGYAAKSATAGGVSGLLLGLAALALPGVGPIVAAGPIAAALAGAGIGATAGGLLGALADMGVPEKEASKWADVMQAGGALVIVRAAAESEQRAVDILKAHDADTVARHQVAALQSGPDYDPANPHTQNSLGNVGDEGGSTQWGQSVLRADSDQPAKRTFSRDVEPKRTD